MRHVGAGAIPSGPLGHPEPGKPPYVALRGIPGYVVRLSINIMCSLVNAWNPGMVWRLLPDFPPHIFPLPVTATSTPPGQSVPFDCDIRLEGYIDHVYPRAGESV